MKIFLLILLIMLTFTQFQEIDKLFERFNKPDSPGCSLSIFNNGRMAYLKGYGNSNLEYNIPFNGRERFGIASISKQCNILSFKNFSYCIIYCFVNGGGKNIRK
jgi:hypothetical protein